MRAWLCVVLVLLAGCVRASQLSLASREDGATEAAPDGMADLGLRDLARPDLPVPDQLAPDLGPPCPSGMAGVGSYCIDQAQGATQTWVAAAADCMAQGKRLCSETEWVTACNATGKGMLDMTDGYEWLAELADDTSAKKRGDTSCSDASSHSVVADGYQTRCCYTPSVSAAGMADFGAFRIDQLDSSTTWVRGVAACMAQGKRLCSDTEWVTACTATGKGMVGMTGEWEWLAELANATEAKKRGGTACGDTSSHDVTADPYDTRCCYTP